MSQLEIMANGMSQKNRSTKMKITKRQLKRIIKEEKAKLLRESVSDMIHFEEAADQAASRMSGLF